MSRPGDQPRRSNDLAAAPAEQRLAFTAPRTQPNLRAPTAPDASIATEAGAATYQAAAAATDRPARLDAMRVAPIAGIVSQRLAQVGERVGGHQLIEIVDLSRIEPRRIAAEDVAACRRRRQQLVVDGLAEPWPRRSRLNEHAGRHPRGDGLPCSRRTRIAPGAAARGSIESQRKRSVVPLSAVRVDQESPTARSGERQGRAAQRHAGLRGDAGSTVDSSAVEIASGLPTARPAAREPARCDGTAVSSRRGRGRRSACRRHRLVCQRVRRAERPRIHGSPVANPVMATMVAFARRSGRSARGSRPVPEHDFPTVVVAFYPGASPEIVESEVTKKVEEAVNTVRASTRSKVFVMRARRS